MQLTTTFVPTILGKCYREKFSGLFAVKSDPAIKKIYFKEGNIIFATSNLPEEQIENRIIEWSILPKENLSKLQFVVKEQKLSILQTLKQHLNQEEMYNLLDWHIKELIYSTFTWQSSIINFSLNTVPEFIIQNPLSTTKLIVDGINRLGNLTAIKAMLADIDAFLKLSPNSYLIEQTMSLNAQEKVLLNYIKENLVTTNILIKKQLTSESNTLKIIAILVSVGLVTVEGKAKNNDNDKNKTKNITDEDKDSLLVDTGRVMKFCYDVESKMRMIISDASFYELLEVTCKASSEEIKQAYERLARYFHPNRQNQLNVYKLDLSLELNTIFNRLSEATYILTNLAQRQIYDKKLSNQLRRNTGSLAIPQELTNTDKILPEVILNNTNSQTIQKDQALTTCVTTSNSSANTQESAKEFTNKLAPKIDNWLKDIESIDAKTPPKKSNYSEALQNESTKNKLSEGAKPSGQSKSITAVDFYMRSIELYDKRQFDQAIVALQKALEVSPRDAEYWAQLGRIYSKMPGKTDMTIRAYQKALTYSPDDEDYLVELALFYKKSSIKSKTLEILQKILEINPHNTTANRILEQEQSSSKSKTGELLGLLSMLKSSK